MTFFKGERQEHAVSARADECSNNGLRYYGGPINSHRGQTYSEITGRVMGNTGDLCLTLLIKYNKRPGNNLDSSIISTFKRWGETRIRSSRSLSSVQ